ncbi:MAG: cadherin-like beta sandwich domain-containing protein, partial [Verrucomicrobia bacterium]|nr:cadherin-like beta sandwich domain-containing protein [Verrucomicrobiota bacterium]
DTANNLVRKIIINPLEPLTNQVRTVTMAGGNDVGYLDSADSDLARFNSPYGVALDNAGNVYVADKGNHRIRMVGGSSPAYVARLGDSSPAVNVSGSADIAVSFPATGLPAYDNPESGLKTLYYFRALGSNSVGMAYGSVLHFTTYSTNAMLEVLGVENDTAPLTPAFSPDITNYSATVPTATAEVLVSAIGERNFEDGSEISTHVFQVGGVTCNNPVPIGEPGSVTTITVLVTAQDGLTRSAYSIAVTRATTPLALSLPASNIASTSVTLRGTMSPNSLTTAAGSYFQYSTKSVFGSGAWTTPISGFKPYTREFWINSAENLAVDDLGNVYYGTAHAVTTVRVDPAGSPTNSQNIFVAANFGIWVYGCAVNHAGTEVYWGDQSYQALVKYVRNGNGWAQSRIASTPGWVPVSVALHEPSGNIYAVLYKTSAGGNPSENKVVCIGTNGVVSSPPGATNLSVPMTVACDPAGNLYVMEYFSETLPGNNRLSRLAPDGQITSLVTTNLAGVQGTAADSQGNVYVSFSLSSGWELWSYNWNGTVWNRTRVNLGNGASSAGIGRLYVDGADNLYVLGYDGSGYPKILKYVPGPTAKTAIVDAAATNAVSLLGTTDIAVSFPLTNLSAGVKYYYRVVTTNSVNTTYGDILSFTTVSGDATLKSLTLGAGTLAPVFAPATNDYAVTVPVGTTSMTLTPTVNQSNATVAVNGQAAVSGAPFGPLDLALGTNLLVIQVVATDGTTNRYTVTVTRPAGSPVALTLAVDPTTVRTNEATLAGSVDANGALSVSAFFQFSTNSTLTIADPLLPAKEGSTEGGGAVPQKLRMTGLAPASTYYYRLVATNDFGTTLGSTLSFTTQSSDALLTNLTISVGALEPVFRPESTDFSCTVSNAPVSTTVTATTRHQAATVTINGVTTSSGSKSLPINLSVGTNVIRIVVTAEDKVTQRTYIVAVNKLQVPLRITENPISQSVFSAGSSTNYTTVSTSATSWTNVMWTSGPAPNVAFRVGVMASDLPVQYQWYRDGQPVGGETNETFSVAVSATNHGAIFHAVATDASSVCATSSPATLLVEMAENNFSYAFDKASSGHGSVDWQNKGSVSWANDSGYTAMPKRMRITSASSSQLGSSWYGNAPVNPARRWSFSWGFQGGYGNPPADSFSFFLQSDGTNATAYHAGDTTVTGLANRFLAITLDDYQNSPTDASRSTLKVTYGTNTSQTQFPVVNLATAFTNGNDAPGFSTPTTSYGPPYNLSATYLPASNLLTVTIANTRLDGMAPGSTNNPLTFTYGLNLAALFGTNATWVGFGGKTGGYSENHDVLYANGLFSSGITPVPVLANLAISEGILTPTFGSNDLSYTADVGFGAASVTLTPTRAEPGTTITVNGIPVASGTASQPLPLAFGVTPLTVVLTAADGVTVNQYSVLVTRPCIPPVISTLAATEVSGYSAKLNCTVNPGGRADVYFQYSTNAGFSPATTLLAQANIGGTNDQPVSLVLDDLASLATYYFRALATNSAGTDTGSALSFSTPWLPLTVVTQPTNAVGTLTFPTNYIVVSGSPTTWANVRQEGNAPVSFDAKAAGGVGPIGYQWYRDGVPVADQTNRSLIVAAAAANSHSEYVLVATDATSVTATSQVARLTLAGPAGSFSYAFDQTATGHSSTDWRATGSGNWANDNGYGVMPRRMRLTGASSSQSGSYWYRNMPLIASRDWSFSWGFQGGYGNPPADTCSFFLQSDGTNAVAYHAGDLSVSGLTGRFVCITLDEYQNTPTDPSRSTLKVTYGTNTSQSQLPVVNLVTAFASSNDAPTLSTPAGSYGPAYNLTASYNAASNLLTVTLANSRLSGPTPGSTNQPLTYSYTVNLANVFGTNEAWVGFGAKTGGFSQNHDILNVNGMFTPGGNAAPLIVNPITDQATTFNSPFSFTFPENTFSDPDGNTLTYTAYGLPGGITFNPGTRTFSGTPTAAGSNRVALVASDSFLTTTNTFS